MHSLPFLVGSHVGCDLLDFPVAHGWMQRLTPSRPGLPERQEMYSVHPRPEAARLRWSESTQRWWSQQWLGLVASDKQEGPKRPERCRIQRGLESVQ